MSYLYFLSCKEEKIVKSNFNLKNSDEVYKKSI